MLILICWVGEILMIGDEVIVIVFGVKGNQVCIGINVFKNVLVYCEEIYQCIKGENEFGVVGLGENIVE